MRTKSTPQRRRRSKVAVQRAARGAPASARLREWARAAARPGYDVTLRIVGAAEARRLNRAFRKRDHATNVLSFSYGPAHGDLVLCHPVIAREARAWKKKLSAHYAHLVVHGMLHLRGRDHARRDAARRMERAEIALLARLGFGNPYTVE
jgi:probable rRNA maturation factor